MMVDRSSSGNEFCLSSDRSKLLRPLRSPAQSSSNRSVDSGVQISKSGQAQGHEGHEAHSRKAYII